MSKPARKCPICSKIYTDYPALSREDNKTEICPECGQQQALNAIPPKTECKFNFKETPYTSEDCISLMKITDCTDMILVLDFSALNPQYCESKYQLWRATGGFGTKNYTIGTAVFAKCLYDSDENRWNRNDFIGALKPELAKQFTKGDEQ